MNPTAYLLLLLAAPLLASAGGSNYGIAPGALPDVAGKVREWPVSTPKFARDPAAAPDGSIFISVMSGNKVARFDPRTQTFREWDLPSGHRPHGVLVDKRGIVRTTGNGNGSIGRLDPAAMKVVKEYALPGGNAGPYAVTVDGRGMVWVNEINTDTVVRFDPKTEQMRVVQLPSRNTGIRKMIVDAGGRLWYMGSHSGRLGVVE